MGHTFCTSHFCNERCTKFPEALMNQFRIATLTLTALWFLGGCAASRNVVQVPEELSKKPADSGRHADVVKYEKELSSWDAKAHNIRNKIAGTKSESKFNSHTKALDDIEGQMKEARMHIKELQDAKNLKEEREARNDVIENFTTIDRIYRQLRAE